MKPEEKFMRLAIEEAMKAPWPFGAVIVENGEVIAAAGSGDGTDNSTDPTAHAEINAIRLACKKLGVTNFEGRDVTLYASCEPCIMCMSAIWYADVRNLVYGSSIAEEQTVFNWKDLALPHETFQALMSETLSIKSGFLKDEVMRMYKAHQTPEKFRHATRS